jgi:hypothetical protein
LFSVIINYCRKKPNFKNETSSYLLIHRPLTRQRSMTYLCIFILIFLSMHIISAGHAICFCIFRSGGGRDDGRNSRTADDNSCGDILVREMLLSKKIVCPTKFSKGSCICQVFKKAYCTVFPIKCEK